MPNYTLSCLLPGQTGGEDNHGICRIFSIVLLWLPNWWPLIVFPRILSQSSLKPYQELIMFQLFPYLLTIQKRLNLCQNK